jgi:hypothetical protein
MLLAGLGARWQHVRGVARQAQRVSQGLAPEDRPYLVAAAWLHDIGYAPDLAATAFHPIDGARTCAPSAMNASPGWLPTTPRPGGRPRPSAWPASWRRSRVRTPPRRMR